MKVLVINCGSSSLKYQLINMTDESLLAKGLCERIGIDGSNLKHEPTGKDAVVFDSPMPDHQAAVKLVLDALLNADHGVIKSIDEVNAVGHRVVHGGEKYSGSVVVTDEVKAYLEECAQLAPLHNPPNLIGINACQALMPGVSHVAVFDTAFHQTMPEKAYLYAIPYALYENHKVRKYGFHGTSHMYVSNEAAKLLGKPYDSLKIITCHLGNGASIAAVKNGKVVDTSMGLTPLEGLVMGTRSGDLDPAVISFVAEKEGMTAKEVENMLNKKSGVLGVSCLSSDFRDIEKAADEGNKKCQIALDMFRYRVAKYIGSYAAAMNGVDAIVFTAGLGENSATARAGICEYLGFLGVSLDAEKNSLRGKALDISTPDAKVRVLVVPTNEELVIARDTKMLLTK